MQRSALTVVISFMSLRRNIGAGRAAVLRRAADFMVTICGVQGKTGWVGLRYCCPCCGYVPFSEQGWFFLEGAGPYRLKSWGAMTQEQQHRWRRLENDPHHDVNMGEFFSAERSSGWVCGACGDEFPMNPQNAEDNPQMLLAVQKGPSREADMVFFQNPDAQRRGGKRRPGAQTGERAGG